MTSGIVAGLIRTFDLYGGEYWRSGGGIGDDMESTATVGSGVDTVHSNAHVVVALMQTR